MARVSSKSGLSPSATRGASEIDLGKDSGVDIGRKAQPSVTSGGIGVTQEVAIGGITVTGGVSVEVSPIAISVSGSPSENSISISGSAELPGGLLGVSGATTIDTNTGEITGGSVGGEIGGFGINVSSNKGNIGIEFTYQIPFSPIEISLGFGSPPKKPASAPTPTPASIRPGVGNKIAEIPLTLFDNNCLYYVLYFQHGAAIQMTFDAPLVKTGDHHHFKQGTWISTGNLIKQENLPNNHYSPGFIEWHDYPTRLDRAGYKINDNDGFAQLVGFGSSSPGTVNGNIATTYYNGSAGTLFDYGAGIKNWIANWIIPGTAWDLSIIKVSCMNSSQPPIALTPISQPPFPSSSPFLPFPNPPPRKENMDNCCRESTKLLRQIYKGLGISKFPGQLPATIIQEIPKEGEAPAEPAQVPIADFVDLLDWQFRRDDERWGQWEVQINVKDADVTQEGDQGKSVKFPNLAESVAEIEGQLLSLTTNIDAVLAIATKNLVESGLARQEAIKGYLASKSIIKYMAFKSTEIDVTVPSCFTPGAETIHELIAESEIHVKGLDYTEKETLRDIFLDLLQAAAVIRAVHWQRIDTKKDTKSQLLGILKGSLDLANSINNPAKPTDGEGKPNPAQNFEDFIDSAESGFTNTTGITDIQNPYGKTPDRRPRIRQIGDNISQAGSDN